jgi:hypothetical protein
MDFISLIRELSQTYKAIVIWPKDIDQANLVFNYKGRKFQVLFLSPPNENSSKMFISVPVLSYEGNGHLSGILKRRGKKNFVWRVQTIVNGTSTRKFCISAVSRPNIRSANRIIKELLKEAIDVLEKLEQVDTPQSAKAKLKTESRRKCFFF